MIILKMYVMSNKQILNGLSIILILWFTGCTGKKTATSLSEQGIPVKIQEIKPSVEENQNDYVGIVEESISVPVSFLTSGQVTKVFVSEGQKVHKGQLLAELNSSNYQSMYQISRSKEKQAEDAYKRLSDLYKKESLPEIKFIEVQTGVEQARSATQISLKNLNDCKLYSPMNGVIGTRSIELGMNILPAVTVFKVVKIDKVFVKISVPENEISKIKTGQHAQISVTALDNESFEGVIEEKGVMANPLSHTYDIKIALSNPKEKLMPGMVCKVLIHHKSPTDQVVVPANVIQIDRSGQKYVLVADVNTKKVVKKFVNVGAPYQNGVIITSGLQTGDQLIIEGYQKISETSAIQIVK